MGSIASVINNVQIVINAISYAAFLRLIILLAEPLFRLSLPNAMIASPPSKVAIFDRVNLSKLRLKVGEAFFTVSNHFHKLYFRKFKLEFREIHSGIGGDILEILF